MGLGVCEAQAGPSRREGARVVSRTATRGRAESTRIMSLVASAGRTPRVRGRDIEPRRDTERTEIVPGSGVRTVLVIINESPRPTCRAHRKRRAGGPEDPRSANEPRNSIKKSGTRQHRATHPGRVLHFTQFSPLTKEVSVSFRVSHIATSVFASVRRDVLVRSYSVGVVAIEYRTVLRA
jgi:hypothetical protein